MRDTMRGMVGEPRPKWFLAFRARAVPPGTARARNASTGGVYWGAARSFPGRRDQRRHWLLVKQVHQPLAEDVRLLHLTGPPRPVEHGQRHHQRMMLPRPVAADFELPVHVVDQGEALPGGGHVLEPELARE